MGEEVESMDKTERTKYNEFRNQFIGPPPRWKSYPMIAYRLWAAKVRSFEQLAVTPDTVLLQAYAIGPVGVERLRKIVPYAGSTSIGSPGFPGTRTIHIGCPNCDHTIELTLSYKLPE